MLFRANGTEASDSELADTDAAAAAAAAAGDKEAFAALVSKYERYIFRTAYLAVGNVSDAEDLAQEIFLRVWHGLPSFRGDARFFAWMSTIARNTCTNHLRAQMCTLPTDSLTQYDEEDGSAVTADVPDPDPAVDPQQRLEEHERAALVCAAIAALSEEHRTILRMHDELGATYEEIAAVLRLEVGTVKSRLFRARQRVRAYLEAHGFFP